VYLDGVLQTNTSSTYYNATGLSPDTSYEIGTHKAAESGNVDSTWMNQTTKTAAASDTSTPLVTNPSATSAIILNDNDRSRIPGTNISQPNVTIMDNTEVDTVTIDLSPIGGSAQMTNIPGTDIWPVTVNATTGINLTHNLIVTATDTSGNSNTSVSIQLTVLRGGDVFRNSIVDLKDAYMYPGIWQD
jgi:hypothetical protein